MSVKVKCPGCDKVLSAPDQARGKAIKCPACETKVRVPAEEAAVKSTKKKAAAKDSDDFLATMDLRNAEDRKARICPKCGFDFKHQDEEETECPECGYDTALGGQGAAARKRALRGPDPDKFFQTVWGDGWKFVGRNQNLAWRTIMYMMICSLLGFLNSFMFLYNSAWPPRVFFGFVTVVCFMVMPGWLWYLDLIVIDNAIEKRDKLKRVAFDFFMASALGLSFILWNVVFAGPIIAIPAAIGWFLAQGSSPPWIFPLFVAIGYIPVLLMLPAVMGHMTMPVKWPGWMFWKVVPTLPRTIGASATWLGLALATNIPTIAGMSVIGALYVDDIQGVVRAMESNAEIFRTRAAAESAQKKDKPALEEKAQALGEPKPVDYKPLIVPAIIWFLSLVPFGFTALFNLRTNGQFIYYFKTSLDLIGQEKQYKYVAKISREAEEDKPKTTAQDAANAGVGSVLCFLLGLIGGMLYGALSDAGIPAGLLKGAYYGAVFAMAAGGGGLIISAFKESVVWGLVVFFLAPFGDIAYAIMFWEDARQHVFQWLFGLILLIGVMIGAASAGMFHALPGMEAFSPENQAQPEMVAPAGDMAMPPLAAPEAP